MLVSIINTGDLCSGKNVKQTTFSLVLTKEWMCLWAWYYRDLRDYVPLLTFWLQFKEVIAVLALPCHGLGYFALGILVSSTVKWNELIPENVTYVRLARLCHSHLYLVTTSLVLLNIAQNTILSQLRWYYQNYRAVVSLPTHHRICAKR